MSITETIGKGVAWNTAATIFEKFVVLANVFIALAFLTVHEYGLVQLVLSVVSIVGVLQLPGLSDAIVADLSIERGRKELGRMKEILLQYAGLITGLSIIAWAAVFFGSNFIIHLEGGQLTSYYIKIASLIFLASPIRLLSITVLTVSLQFRETALYSIVEEGAKLLGQFIFVIWLRRGPEGLLIATVASQFIAIILFSPWIIRAVRPIMAASAQNAGHFWRSIYKHRAWSIATSYMSTTTGNIQVWAIKLFVGTDAVAIFSVAQGLVSHITSFLPLSPIISPILPRYIDKPPEFRRLLRTSLKVQLLASVALIVGGAVGAPLLVYVFFPKYIGALPVFFILLFSLIPNSLAVVVTPAFAALRRQHSYFFSVAIKTFLTAATFLFFTSLFGLLGAGIASLVTIFLSSIERQWRFIHIEPLYAPEYQRFFSIDAQENALFKELLRKIQARLVPFYTK